MATTLKLCILESKANHAVLRSYSMYVLRMRLKVLSEMQATARQRYGPSKLAAIHPRSSPFLSTK